MTAPAPSGGPSPLRVGGLALLGVGAVAAVVGIGTLVTGGGDSSATATAPTSASAPLTPPPAAAAPSGPEVSVPSFGPTPTNAIAAPTAAPGAGSDGTGSAGGSGAAGGSGGSDGGGGQTVAKSPVRVYNNSTITGLAARAAEDFRNEGWTVTAVSNYPSGNIPTSTVYYRPGTAEQPGAEAMAKQFGMRSEARFAGLDEASPGLIVIVTNDYQKRG